MSGILAPAARRHSNVAVFFASSSAVFPSCAYHVCTYIHVRTNDTHTHGENKQYTHTHTCMHKSIYKHTHTCVCHIIHTHAYMFVDSPVYDTCRGVCWFCGRT